MKNKTLYHKNKVYKIKIKSSLMKDLFFLLKYKIYNNNCSWIQTVVLRDLIRLKMISKIHLLMFLVIKTIIQVKIALQLKIFKNLIRIHYNKIWILSQKYLKLLTSWNIKSLD